MKRALLISDNHGTLSNLLTLKEKVGPVDLVLHMGDIEGNASRIRQLFAPADVFFVSGNCDPSSCGEPLWRVVAVEGHRIYMCHGHMEDVKLSYSGLTYAGHRNEADVVLYGHTHVPDLTYLSDMMIINPGSIARPKQDGRRPSYALLELKEGVFPCYCSIAYL